MNYLDLDSLRAAPLTREPFKYAVVGDILRPGALASIRADFPRIGQPGLFPLSTVSPGPAFSALIEELRSREFETILADKFGIPLEGRSLMVTVRGRCRARDGQIHTDSFDKILTVLLYLNEKWSDQGGNLRLLRGPSDLEDKIGEVRPNGGTLIAFHPSKRSWHGHKPFDGERRYVMLNWMKNAEVSARELARHRLSAMAKRFIGSRGI